MFIELLTAIGIGTAALPSDASEPTPIIDYPDPPEVMCLAENMYHEAKNQGTAGWNAPARNYKRGNVLEGNYLMNWTGPVYMS